MTNRGIHLVLTSVVSLVMVLLVVFMSLQSSTKTSFDNSIARARKYYCNNGAPTGLEGLIDGYDIVGVTVVIRHGARSAIHEALGTERGDYNCELSNLGESVLTDWDCLPEKTADGHCAPGQLLERGFRQHLRLGSMLGLRYDSSKRWSWEARATDYQRTRASAAAFLTGFFFGVPGVHRVTVAPNEGLEPMWGVEPNRGPHCPAVSVSEYLLRANVSVPREFGFQDTRVTAVADALYTRACEKGNQVCAKTTGKCLRADAILDAGDELYEAQYNGNRASVQLGMYPLIHEIVEGMEHLVDPATPHLAVLAAHDTVVAPLAAALNVFDGKWPPLATRLVFELWREPLLGGRYLRVLYNGLDLTRQVPGCALPLCPQADFRAAILAFLHGEPNFQSACGNSVHARTLQSDFVA